jgi:hypothetical protein
LHVQCTSHLAPLERPRGGRSLRRQASSASHSSRARAGAAVELIVVARDAAGVCKSLGGDIFTVAWQRAGDAQPATAGGGRPHARRMPSAIQHLSEV